MSGEAFVADVNEVVLARALRPPPLSAAARARILSRLEQATPPAPRTFTRWWPLAVAAAAIAVWLFLPRPERVGVAQQARLAEVVREGQARSLEAGQPLYGGDHVQTASGGAAVVELNGARWTLAASTKISVGEPTRVTTGQATVDLDAQGVAAVLDTSVRGEGARFHVRVAAAMAFLRVETGTVLASSPAGTMRVTAGERLVIQQGAAPRRVEPSRAAPMAQQIEGSPDCADLGADDCAAMAEAVRKLQQMEPTITPQERRALDEAVAEVEQLFVPAFRELCGDIEGEPPPAHLSYRELVARIGRSLTQEDLAEVGRKAGPRPTPAPPAVRWFDLQRDMLDAVEAALARRVPRERVRTILSQRYRPQPQERTRP